MRYRPPALAAIPLLPAALSLIAGILWAAIFPDMRFYGVAVLAALCLSGVWLRRGLPALIAAFLAIGILTAIVHTPPKALLTGMENRYDGIATGVDRYNFSQRVVVRLGGACRGAEVLINVHSSMPVVEPGDTVGFTAVLRPVSGMDSDIPGSRPHLRGAESYRISAIADISPESITGNSRNFAVYPPHPPSISTRFYRLRTRFVDLIYDSGISAPAAAFLAAVLAGDSSYLSTDTRSVFSRAGTAHMLALSGLHVAVIAFLVSLVFFPLRLMRRQKWAIILTVFLLWFYAFLTGMSPSVVRAVIMASVIMIGRVVQRSSSPLNSLCLAAILILLFSPWQLFSVGFQLSFAAVAAILMFAFDLVPDLRMWGVFRRVFGWLAVSVSAVIGIGALSAWYFHQVPLLFIVANIPAAVLLPFVMGGELLNILFSAAGWHCGAIADAVSSLYGGLESTAYAVAGTMGSSFQNIYFPSWLLIPYYIALVVAWIAMKRRSRFFALASAMIFMFFGGAYALTRFQAVKEEAYVVEYPYSTVIVAFDGYRCYLFTDAPESQFDRVLNVTGFHLRDFVGRRGGKISSVNPELKAGAIYADSALWCFGDLTIAPVRLRNNLHPVTVTPRYALVSARYFGTMRQVVDSLKPDTVVIAGNVTGDRRMKFINELDSIGIPYRTGLPVRLL